MQCYFGIPYYCFCLKNVSCVNFLFHINDNEDFFLLTNDNDEDDHDHDDHDLDLGLIFKTFCLFYITFLL